MENEVFTPLLEQFMLSPLVCWVRSYRNPPSSLSVWVSSPPLTPPHCSIHLQVKTAAQSTVTDGTKLSEYVELVDGIYLNEIMLEM